MTDSKETDQPIIKDVVITDKSIAFAFSISIPQDMQNEGLPHTLSYSVNLLIIPESQAIIGYIHIESIKEVDDKHSKLYIINTGSRNYFQFNYDCEKQIINKGSMLDLLDILESLNLILESQNVTVKNVINSLSNYLINFLKNYNKPRNLPRKREIKRFNPQMFW